MLEPKALRSTKLIWAPLGADSRYQPVVLALGIVAHVTILQSGWRYCVLSPRVWDSITKARKRLSAKRAGTKVCSGVFPVKIHHRHQNLAPQPLSSECPGTSLWTIFLQAIPLVATRLCLIGTWWPHHYLLLVHVNTKQHPRIPVSYGPPSYLLPTTHIPLFNDLIACVYAYIPTSLRYYADHNKTIFDLNLSSEFYYQLQTFWRPREWGLGLSFVLAACLYVPLLIRPSDIIRKDVHLRPSRLLAWLIGYGSTPVAYIPIMTMQVYII